MSYIRKIKPADGVFLSGFHFSADELERWPALCEHLSMSKYDDGTNRKTSSFSVFVEHDQLKVAFNDKDNGRVAFLTIGTLETFLDALELGLVADSLDWRRAWTPKGKGK